MQKVTMLDYDFHLTTPRLYMSYFNPDNDAHCAFTDAFISSRGVANQIRESGLSLPTERPGRTFIVDGVEKMAKTGYGRYLISLEPGSAVGEVEDSEPFSQRTLELVGAVSMQCARYPNAPTIPDVGFGLLPKHFGKGYATEAAQRLLQYFEEERGQKVFGGYCKPDNEASKNVLRKLGFEERGLRTLNGMLPDGKLFELSVWTKGVGWKEGALEEFGM
jgi:RimJ/RimL family protein N-acetyltransferase